MKTNDTTEKVGGGGQKANIPGKHILGCPLTPGGLWDSNKFEIWGQWLVGDKVSEKFNLKHAGKASLFEGKTTPPQGVDKAKLQILAADQAGNFGVHTNSFRIGP